MPNQTGNVAYSDPRAVMVKAKGDIVDITGEPHSAVSGNFVVLTNSITQANTVIERWPDIMAELTETINNILESENDT